MGPFPNSDDFIDASFSIVLAIRSMTEESPQNIFPCWKDNLAEGFKGLCQQKQLSLANVLQLQVITGPSRGDDFYLPRVPIITLVTSGTGFRMRRLQFFILAAFAMTINKCQGQTKSYVGVYLPTPMFTHGQLYVNLSRVGFADAVDVLAPRGITRNVVYPEAL
ncbi:hypothetical protein GWK47_015342 [Chionoecetes opilio]|uniref:ATP-dependent DNA helicase n=1 Tax=Chionoecetes opilio TaxID=41210 RepID=A0A8J4XU44_CHIOP|nr:hypothetical protein GWK47_015342 [Chionoecetes opilio]